MNVTFCYVSCHNKQFVVSRCEEYLEYKRFDTKENIMNSWIMNAYSDAYSTAMMLDVKPAAVAKKKSASRFSKLVTLLARA